MEITQINEDLFEVKVSQDYTVSQFYLTREQFKKTAYYIELTDE